MVSEKPKKRVIFYVLCTCLLSWSWLGGAYFLGYPWEGNNMIITGAVLMWIPGVVALAMDRMHSAKNTKQRLPIKLKFNRWWCLAWLGAPGLTLLTIGLSLLLPGHYMEENTGAIIEVIGGALSEAERVAAVESIDALPIPLFWLQLIQGLTIGGGITALVAFGEELGWRGYLDREVTWLGWGFWKSSLSIGALWGLWHWPIVLQGHNYPNYPVLGIFLMIFFCMGLAPLFTFVTRMGGSVLTSALAHGTLNATAILPYLMVGGGNELTIGMTSLIGMGVLVITNLALIPLVQKHQERLQVFWLHSE